MIFLLIVFCPYIHLPIFYFDKPDKNFKNLETSVPQTQDLLSAFNLGFSGMTNSFLILITSLDQNVTLAFQVMHFTLFLIQCQNELNPAFSFAIWIAPVAIIFSYIISFLTIKQSKLLFIHRQKLEAKFKDQSEIVKSLPDGVLICRNLIGDLDGDGGKSVYPLNEVA